MNVNETVRMPDIRGYPVHRATILLAKMGLGTGSIDYAESKAKPDHVLEQGIPAGTSVPRGTTANLVVSGRSLLRSLPAVYQKEDSRNGDFLKRYLWIVSSILGSVERKIDTIDEYFDPMKAPGDFYRWLGSWFAVNMDFAIPETKLRMLVREAAGLYRWRGTALGLAKMLEIVAGVRPEIVEGPLPIQEYTIRGEKFVGHRTADNSIIDEDVSRHHFTVKFPVLSSSFDEETIRKIHQIIREEKPAHASYYVLFVPPVEQRKTKKVAIEGTVIDDGMAL